MQITDQSVFERSMEATRIALRDGILSINIWDSTSGLTIADWQGNPTGVALVTQLMNDLNITLENSKLPYLKDYIYFDLQHNQALVVIDHGEHLMQGWLLDTSKVNLGILLGMAVPNAIANIKAARG